MKLFHALTGLLFSLSISMPCVFPQDTSSEFQESALKFGINHRFRFVSWDNAIDLNRDTDDKRTFTRHRTSLSLDWSSFRDITIFVKLTNEFRYYFCPSGQDFNIHEVIFDNAYIGINQPLALPLRLTLGRQNMMLGEGFVVMDGHPLDGSRSIYFNAVRLDYQFKENRTLTVFYTYQTETDRQMPLINDQNQGLIEQPEEGIGFYYSSIHGATRFDTYLIRKNIRSTQDLPVHSGINTYGLRFQVPVVNRFSITTETAIQFGTYGEENRLAFGGYFHIDYLSGEERKIPQELTLGSICLTGDNLSTEKMEGWDPLFSRWPKWSESFIYTLIPENGGKVAYWSNLFSVYGTVRFQFHPKVALDISYYYMRALHSRQSLSSVQMGSGRNRGHLFISKTNIHFTRHFSGHILWEAFLPGSYYRESADPFNWFRVELMYQR